MKKRIWIDKERFLSYNVVNTDGDIDAYVFDAFESRKDDIVDTMLNSGFRVKGIECDSVLVDRTIFYFKGEKFYLRQCSDLFEWFGDSQVGEFTYYYSHLVFHHTDGRFYSADIENTSNYIQI